MRPCDLLIPEQRLQGLSIIHDKICYLPKLAQETDSFIFPSWDDTLIFGNKNPVNVEFCSGNGAWIAAKAQENPNINWVAVEIKRERTRKIWSKIKNHQLDNLFVVNGEGEFATENCFPKDSVDAIFINFPDPWPKRYHAKLRLVKPSFVSKISGLLKDQGSVTFVTDDEEHSKWAIKIFNASEHFTSSLPAPFYTTEWENYGNSYFETLWREKGKTIRYHHFIKNR